MSAIQPELGYEIRVEASRRRGCVVVWGVCLGFSAIASATGWAGELARYESTQPQMGVPFKIILYAPDEAAAKGAFDAAFARIAELNRILSDYDPHSELSRLSRGAPSPQPVRVSEPLWHVLSQAQALAEKTGGAFDVTVGPYVRLWRRARRNGEMPSTARLWEARRAVGYQLLSLDAKQQSAQLLAPGMRLDLGGIAMGYAVDEALELLRKRGIARALVDASGDIGVGDPPPGREAWVIDVAPVDEDGAPKTNVLLANAAVTTSGDALQHVEIGGTRYSHIVDPRTGLGLTDRTSVTVIARDCTTADSLATAVSVLGPTAGLKLIADTPGTAVWIVHPADGGKWEAFESPGFRNFVDAGKR
jgi:thiamine biosynthesis lipoprotein